MKKIIILINIFILLFSSFSYTKAENNTNEKIINSFIEKYGNKKFLIATNFYEYLNNNYKNNKKINNIKKSLEVIINKYYNEELKNISKDYFIFSDIKSYLKNTLNIKEKKEIINILNNIKKESKKLQNEMKKVFKLNISEDKRKKLVILLDKKIKKSFDNWRKKNLSYVKNKDKYKAYENYILHTYFGKIHSYLVTKNTFIWENAYDMEDDYKEKGLVFKKAPIKNYNLKEIIKHNTKKDCWTIIDEKVYDLTIFFGHHDGGGRALLDMCGKDGSTLFHWAHAYLMNGKYLTNNDVSSLLKKFYIGNLIR